MNEIVNEVVENTAEEVANEAIAEVADSVNGHNGLKTAGCVAAIGGASIVAWELAIKPAGKWIKKRITCMKQKIRDRKESKHREDEAELTDDDLGNIPELDD